MIKIKGISKVYNPEKDKPLVALDNINLEFSKGEFACIFGKSGSGKSTLLNIIAGLDKATKGSISIEDKDMGRFSDIEMADCRRNKIGFVFQDFQLLEHLTVLENVELGLCMDSVSKKDKRKKAIEVLEKVELGEHLNHKPSELSGGQKQRVSIARALVKDPEILIADEPTGALDSKTSYNITKLLENIAKDGKLVLVVTHDDEFKSYASRVVTLRDGKIIDDSRKCRERSMKEYESEVKKRKFDLSSAFRLSMKRLYERRWRYFLVSISMIIGICSLSIAFGISKGIQSYINHANEKIIDNKKLSFSKKEEFNSDDYFDINQHEDVKFLQSEFLLNVKTVIDDEVVEFNAKSIIQEEYSDKYTRPSLLYGEMPKDGEKEMALSLSLAEELSGGEDVKELIGQEVDMKFLAKDELANYPSRWDEQTIKITGITEKSLIDEEFAYIPYDVHIDFASRSRFVPKNNEVPTNNISVYLNDSEAVDEVYREFSEKYEVIRPSDRLEGITDIFKNFNLLILAGAMLILIISALMIGIILFISVLERQKEIGLFISIGGTRRDIKMIFVTEGILLGIIAAVSGGALSMIFKLIINPLAVEHMNYEIFRPDFITVITSIALGVCISFVASVIPATKASKLSPIELLRRN